VARGPARSRPVSEIIEELRSIAEQGYLEVVLTGVHLGSYGRDLGVPHGLEHLVTAILRESVVQRLRLSSLEPWDVDSNLLALFDDPRLLPHLHIPLQSGCDTTLTRMARPITCAAFLELVAEARSHIPDLSVSTDIMVGFPGETDADFEASLAFVKAAAFSRLHIFRYSRRKGTLAAAMPDQVPTAVATERSRRMHALGADLELAFNRRFVGRAMPVLWESGHEIGGQRRWSGLTDNYIRVAATANATVDLTNTVADAEILTTIPGGVEGRVRGASSIPIVDQ
jgi:threonylcarbamoyladenosine tRNA methylthiotransferase MtaB